MTREEALALLALPSEQAIERILELARKAALWDGLLADAEKAKPQEAQPAESSDEPGPLTPSGMTATFLKPPPAEAAKTPGRKPGHIGSRRPRPARIDHYHRHELTACPDCGQPLGRPVRTYRRLIEDIPPVQAQVHEHAVQGYWCGHCRKIVTSRVTAALPQATLGLNGLVLGAWLHYLLGVSVGNVARLLAVGFAFPVSPGGLTQAWSQLATTLEPYYQQLEQQVRSAAVVNADETGWRLNGITHWLWAFCTADICYFLIDPHRSSAVVLRVLGEWFAGFLVCDFYAAYNAVEAWAKQRCLFHLFAELLKVDKRNTSAVWQDFRQRLSALFKEAMALKLQQAALAAALFALRRRQLHQQLDALIAASFDDADAQRLQKRLRNFRGELLTFLDHAAVPPTNNLAEQQMRKPVAARKVCQQNRSQNGAETHAILLSLLRTAELQGQDPVRFVIGLTQAAIAGRPIDLFQAPPLQQAA